MNHPFKIIEKAQANNDYSIRIEWNGGDVSYVSLKDEIGQSSILAFLKNIEQFKTIKIIDNGRALSWPNGVDYCADALWDIAFTPDLRAQPLGRGGKRASLLFVVDN